MILPTYVLGFLTTACSYLAQNVGVSVKALNLKANAFGNMVLTNVGSIGHQEAFAPIPCPTHCCICIAQGKVTKKPVVVDDQIVIRDIMKVVYTVDHRFGDAAILQQFCQIVKDCLEDPENFDANKYPQLPNYEDMDRSKKAQ